MGLRTSAQKTDFSDCGHLSWVSDRNLGEAVAGSLVSIKINVTTALSFALLQLASIAFC